MVGEDFGRLNQHTSARLFYNERMKKTRNRLSLRKIRSSENKVASLITKELSEYLRTGDEFIKLILEALEQFQSIVWSEKDFGNNYYSAMATVSLTATAINQLEAMRHLLLRGLLQPFVVLSRSLFETCIFASYLSVRPEEAQNWAGRKKIRISTVRKGLPVSDSYSLLYAQLSEISHPNLSSSLPHMFEIKDKETPSTGFFLGGVDDKLKIENGAKTYASYCVIAATVFMDSVFSNFGVPEDWKDLKDALKIKRDYIFLKFGIAEQWNAVKSEFEDAINENKL
jgi:hypothetical protein